MPNPTVVHAKHPTLGTIFAAVDSAVRFTPPRIGDTRFGAVLTPFATEEAARAALRAAGAEPAEGGKR